MLEGGKQQGPKLEEELREIPCWRDAESEGAEEESDGKDRWNHCSLLLFPRFAPLPASFSSGLVVGVFSPGAFRETPGGVWN